LLKIGGAKTLGQRHVASQWAALRCEITGIESALPSSCFWAEISLESKSCNQSTPEPFGRCLTFRVFVSGETIFGRLFFVT